MRHRYQMVRLSANSKLGGLPASTTSASTCPTRCSLRHNGCYAEAGHSGINFRAVSEGKRGGTLDEFCRQIKSLPRFSLWRHNQAGDLPGDQTLINHQEMHKIVSANRGRHGFTFTHYDPKIQNNAQVIGYANAQGFTVNLSAETLAEADEFVALGVAPVVVILPIGQTSTMKTPAGNTVMVCPATTSSTTCALCAICAKPERKFIIGFPAHGSGRAKAQKVFYMAQA